MAVLMGNYGGSQSDYLIHFTRRGNRRHSKSVPVKIQVMSAEERLGSIIRDGAMRLFRPFGAEKPCACFTETTLEHLRYLLNKRGYSPWGIVMTRDQVLDDGGGTVTYTHRESTLTAFRNAGLGHWAVRTGGEVSAVDWTYEREWRIPWHTPQLPLKDRVRAILISNEFWRPVPKDEELPDLWKKSHIWVWRPEAEEGKGAVTQYAPGDLT
ncbi:hypothetical protein [Streptomyces olivaceiscleroticus]|uniref:Uncharacterized protein n=1 Tax=Streptomyces olivaceiscleroticus TaxID=68245 RepID=A0ABN1APD8_9ACTN